MKDRKVLAVRVGVVVFNVICYLSSFLYQFPLFYHSRPSDLIGLVLTILFLAADLLLIVCLKRVKAAQWTLLALSAVSILSVVVMWLAHLGGASVVTAYFTGLVVAAIPPFYGISFLFGTGASYLAALSFAVVLPLLLKVAFLVKGRPCPQATKTDAVLQDGAANRRR